MTVCDVKEDENDRQWHVVVGEYGVLKDESEAQRKGHKGDQHGRLEGG